jgi:hypothetical protein
MHAWKGSQLSPFSFIHGTCGTCHGNRFTLPGSLECMSLIGWPEVPLPILLYQLDIELNFAEKEISQCHPASYPQQP